MALMVDQSSAWRQTFAFVKLTPTATAAIVLTVGGEADVIGKCFARQIAIFLR